MFALPTHWRALLCPRSRPPGLPPTIQRCQAHRYSPSKVSKESSTAGGALWPWLKTAVATSLQNNKANVLQADPYIYLSGRIWAPPLGTYMNKRIIWQGAKADFLKYVLCAGRLVVESSGVSMNNRSGPPRTASLHRIPANWRRIRESKTWKQGKNQGCRNNPAEGLLTLRVHTAQQRSSHLKGMLFCLLLFHISFSLLMVSFRISHWLSSFWS